MKIILGADHRGFTLKQEIKQHLLSLHYTVDDVGELLPDISDDYPDFAYQAAQKVMENTQNRGIIVCGSGVGVCITANKVPGIRCGFGLMEQQVKAAREDDDINMLALASDYIIFDDARRMVEAFLNTSFDATENHVRRIEKIATIEKNYHAQNS